MPDPHKELDAEGLWALMTEVEADTPWLDVPPPILEDTEEHV